MDIILKGELDGIQTAQIIKENYNTPFIYLTAYYDKEILEKAQKTLPAAYITKPYEEKGLQTAIQLAINL
jgi:CheY-like chemotaxis protein